MKTRTQIKTDRFIGVFIAVLLNWLVRLLGFILRLDHSLQKDFKTIVICKFKGMGSIVQATPLLQTLRLNFPKSNIVFITTTTNLELISKISSINQIICINDSSFIKLITTTTKALFSLWKLRISVYLDLEIYSNFSSLITTVSLARNRVGFYRQSSHYRMGIYTHMMYYNIKAPVSKVYLQFAHLLNCREMIDTLYHLTIKPHNSFYEELNLEANKYFIINPNASDLRIERRWQKENFIELIDRINNHFPDHKIILIGSDSEREYVAKISSTFINNPNVIDVSGKTSLDDLLYLLKNAGLVITNDTGPMHLSFSLHTKTLALFGPCSPAQYGNHEGCFVVYNNVYCSPCVHEFDIPPCNGNNQCMQTITVDQVYEVLIRAMNNQPIAQPFSFPIHYTGKNNEVLGVALR